MITKEALTQFVDSRSWYQTIKFEDDVTSKGCDWCGEAAWGNMLKLLPANLNGKRILDLGCNAGLFCVKSALLGATDIVGVDWPGWRPNWDFQEQQVFVKEYFEQKYNTTLPIMYYANKMEDYLNQENVGRFDYVYTIASIYYTETPSEVVENIASITNNVIVRLRDENRITQFTKLFRDNGFTDSVVLHEKWWEQLNKPTDDFYMYLYMKG